MVGAFEQLFGPVSGEFEQKIFQKFKCPGVALGGGGGCGGGGGGGGGGVLKFRFDWHISLI